jgi:hypothetical protein
MIKNKNKNMVKYIKRVSDNKYLQSAENDTWVVDVKNACEMTYRECEVAKSLLLNNYSIENIKEVVNNSKPGKPLTPEEKRELINLLKK